MLLSIQRTGGKMQRDRKWKTLKLNKVKETDGNPFREEQSCINEYCQQQVQWRWKSRNIADGSKNRICHAAANQVMTEYSILT